MFRFSHCVGPLAICMALTIVATATAQNQGRRRGFGRGGLNSITLLAADPVKKELQITEEQTSKLTEIISNYRSAAREAFAGVTRENYREKQGEIREKTAKLAAEAREKVNGVLDEGQQKRLDEISLQIQGAAALSTDKVAKLLGISEDQKAQMAKQREASRAKMREVFQSLRDGDGDRDTIRKKFTELREESDKNLFSVLTDDQKKQFESLQGDKFEYDRSQLFPRRRRQ